jgi:hypothetical protein
MGSFKDFDKKAPPPGTVPRASADEDKEPEEREQPKSTKPRGDRKSN